jgi:hypothetical protein
MPPEVYPLVGIMGIMVSGATFMLYRISQSSDVVWDRKGDWKPWDKVGFCCFLPIAPCHLRDTSCPSPLRRHASET